MSVLSVVMLSSAFSGNMVKISVICLPETFVKGINQKPIIVGFSKLYTWITE